MSLDTKELVQESAGVFLANWQLGLLAGLLQLIPAVGGVFVVNWLAAVKGNSARGEAVELGPLLDVDNAFEKAQGSFLLLVSAVICSAIGALFGVLGIGLSIGGAVGTAILGSLVAFAYALMADKPGMPFLTALRGAAVFAKVDPGLLLKLTGASVLLFFLGALPLGLGLPIALPIASGAYYLAFNRLRPDVEAAAAAAGIELQ